MAVPFADNIKIQNKKQNVERDSFETLEAMKSYSENYLPPIFIATCEETGKLYMYKVANAVTEETGKWREFSGGGADLTNYYTKNQIDNDVVKPVSELAEQNETNIGDMTDLVIAAWPDLVTAINSLYNSFMTSLVYTTKTVDDKTIKVLRITYRNGGSVDIDISAIITDSKIGELNDIDTTGVKDGQVLAFTSSTNKFVPKTFDLEGLLKSANTYTDTQIAESEKTNAVSCDSKPTYDSFTDTVTYYQEHVKKTEENTKSWFYYKNAGGTVVQTRWISGVEFTIDVSEIKLDDYVKTDVVAPEYTGQATETKTNIATLACLDNLKTLIETSLGDKVNVSDIVDNLSSESTDVPLSAKQGKVLDEKITALDEDLDGKLDKKQDEANAGKFVVVDSGGNLTFSEANAKAENVSFENETYTDWTTVKKAIEGLISKVDYVKPSINAFSFDCDEVNEVGKEINPINFSWTLNKAVTSITLTDTDVEGPSATSATYAVPVKANKTFTLTVGDGQNTATKSLTVSFKNKTYWGSASIPDSFDSAFILGLSKNQFATSSKGSYKLTVGSGEYGFIAMPTSFGTLKSVYIGGFETSVESCGSLSFTNASGGVVNYSVYRTGRSGLGEITMEVK